MRGFVIFIMLTVFPLTGKAAVPMEDNIWVGCLNTAEVVFYLAQEKLYGDFSIENLEAELKTQHTNGEVEAILHSWKGPFLWVEANTFGSAKEYAITALGQCLSVNYEHFNLEPTKKAEVYTQRFRTLIEEVSEIPEDSLY